MKKTKIQEKYGAGFLVLLVIFSIGIILLSTGCAFFRTGQIKMCMWFCLIGGALSGFTFIPMCLCAAIAKDPQKNNSDDDDFLLFMSQYQDSNNDSDS